MMRPLSLDDVRRPALTLVPSWVLANGYCGRCGEGVTPEMVLELRGEAWVHFECGVVEGGE